MPNEVMPEIACVQVTVVMVLLVRALAVEVMTAERDEDRMAGMTDGDGRE